MPDLPFAEADAPPTRARNPRLPPPEAAGAPPGPSGIVLPRFPAPPARRRGGLRWSFLLMVVLPTLIGIWYYARVATPQYVTTAVFALRVGQEGGERVGAGPTTLAGALGPTSAGAPVTQSYGIVHYVDSAPSLEDVQRAGIDVRSILTDPRADFLTRLPPDATQEQLLRAWRSIVNAQFELTRGVVTLSTRAFSAEQSYALAEALLASSERLANDMSSRVFADTLRVAEEQYQAAARRLEAARSEQQAFRAASGVLDPTRASTASLDIEMQLRQDLAVAEAQAESLRSAGVQGGPMLSAAQARARALRAQLADAERQASRSAGDRDGVSWASVMARNDALASAVRIAEQQYTQTLGILQAARTDAAQKRTYLLTFVRPTMPTEPAWPNRWLSPLIVAGCALLAWAMLTLIYYAIRDRS
ncbi:MAG TPA: hypothetical protein VE033_05755 [Acetobacteraceae bacterium]|nr:hypothetical protein [Acetobacteraceae bacterium]